MKSRFEAASPGAPFGAERTLGQLFGDLSGETSRLLRLEIALARAELGSAARRVGSELAMTGTGIALAGVGVLTLVAALVVLLGDLLDSYWLSSLMVGLLLTGAGAWLALRAVRDFKRTELAPRETLRSLEETQQWARREAAAVRTSLTAPGGNGKEGGRYTPAAHFAAVREVHTPTPTSRLPREPAGAERERGEGGSRPDQPPPRSAGTMAFLKHVGREISDDDVTGQAAKLAYYAFMALPPALMALFALAGLFGSVQFATWLEAQAAMVMPQEVMDSIFRPFIEDVVLQKAPGPLSVGLLLALWGASSVFTGLMDTLNHAYDVVEDRSFIKKRGVALGVMIGGTLLFLLAAIALLAGPELAELAGLGSTGQLIWTVIRWPLTFAFVVVAFWIGYYLLPNRDQKGCKKVLLKAAALAALLWVVASAAFRLYIANFSSYSETYGFLGAFIILLLWLYVTGLVVLVGGEFASEMEKRA